MDDIRNIDTLELATGIYNLACDLDAADYSETAETEINELENALDNLRNYVVINPAANKNYLTLVSCLNAIVNHN